MLELKLRIRVQSAIVTPSKRQKKMAEGQSFEQDIAGLRAEVAEAQRLPDVNARLDALCHILDGVVGLLEGHQSAITLIRAETSDEDLDDIDGPRESEIADDPPETPPSTA